MAINISAVELRAKDFIQGIRFALQDTGLDPRYLELEITETFLLQDPKSTTSVLQTLKELGVRLLPARKKGATLH
jgi:diguanylate cyclase